MALSLNNMQHSKPCTVLALEGHCTRTVLTRDITAVARHGTALHGCGTAFSLCPFKLGRFSFQALLHNFRIEGQFEAQYR